MVGEKKGPELEIPVKLFDIQDYFYIISLKNMKEPIFILIVD